MHSEFNGKEWKNNVHGVLLPTQFSQSWDTAVSRESHNPCGVSLQTCQDNQGSSDHLTARAFLTSMDFFFIGALGRDDNAVTLHP